MNSSSIPTADLANTVSSLEYNTAYGYCVTVAPVLLMWHYLITFDKELAFFWRQRFSGASALFFANRYLTLAVVIYGAPFWRLPLSDLRCSAVLIVFNLIEYSPYVVWAVFSCLRVYALRRRRRWAALVLVLSLVIVVSSWVVLRFVHSSSKPGGGCNTWTSTPLPLYNSLTIVSRTSLIAAEVIVIAITWAEMRHYRNDGDEATHLPIKTLTLSTVFYNNGRVYFVLTTLLHAFHLICSLLPLTFTASSALLDFLNLTILVTKPLIGILVTHTLIALRAAAAAHVYLSDSEDSLPSLQLSRSQSLSGPRSSCSGSVSLLEFVRADVDCWIQSEHGPCAPGVGVGAALEHDDIAQ